MQWLIGRECERASRRIGQCKGCNLSAALEAGAGWPWKHGLPLQILDTVKQEVDHGNDAGKTRTQSAIGSVYAASRQDAVSALDDVLASYFEWEQQDYQASVEAIRRGNDDVMAGRTKPADEVHNAIRQKYGFSG